MLTTYTCMGDHGIDQPISQIVENVDWWKSFDSIKLVTEVIDLLATTQGSFYWNVFTETANPKIMKSENKKPHFFVSL